MLHKNLPPVPDFANDEEEAEFWDTHSSVGYATGPLRPTQVVKPKDMAISIRLTTESRERLNSLAARYRMGPSRFVRAVIDALLDEPEKVPFLLSPKPSSGKLVENPGGARSSRELVSQAAALLSQALLEPDEEPVQVPKPEVGPLPNYKRRVTWD